MDLGANLNVDHTRESPSLTSRRNSPLILLLSKYCLVFSASWYGRQVRSPFATYVIRTPRGGFTALRFSISRLMPLCQFSCSIATSTFPPFFHIWKTLTVS